MLSFQSRKSDLFFSLWNFCGTIFSDFFVLGALGDHFSLRDKRGMPVSEMRERKRCSSEIARERSLWAFVGGRQGVWRGGRKIKHLTNRQQHADIDALTECGKNNKLSYSLAQKWSHDQSSGFYFFFGGERVFSIRGFKKSTLKVAFVLGSTIISQWAILQTLFKTKPEIRNSRKKKKLGTVRALISGDATACCISLPPDTAKGKEGWRKFLNSRREIFSTCRQVVRDQRFKKEGKKVFLFTKASHFLLTAAKSFYTIQT